MEQDTLNAKQVAELLQLHPVTVRLYAAAGTIPGRQVGNRWRFSRAAIAAWLARKS